MQGEHQQPATSRSLLSMVSMVAIRVGSGEHGGVGSPFGSSSPAPRGGRRAATVVIQSLGSVTGFGRINTKTSCVGDAGNTVHSTDYLLGSDGTQSPTAHVIVELCASERRSERISVASVVHSNGSDVRKSRRSPSADRAVLEKRNQRSSAAQSLGVPRTVRRRCRGCGGKR